MKDTKAKVTGIGGIFFKCNDPEKVKAWYGKHLGLAVNELVTNALKHGFASGESGEIGVEIRSDNESGGLKLAVRDTGKGFPQDFTPETTPSLGFQLVLGLTSQLEGRLEINTPDSQGTEVAIIFPLPDPTPHPQAPKMV